MNEQQLAALKSALEALEWMVANDDTNEGDEPIDRLGGQSWNEYNSYWLDGLNNARTAITAIKAALSQPAPVPLTDDARGLLVVEHLGPNALLHKPMSIYDAFHMGIDAAEAAHGITKGQP